ncbi:carbohydrate kinase [Mycoplasmatota bacterium]|nr:carbohydrate kinase [Mycoplasmatota bacterium]
MIVIDVGTQSLKSILYNDSGEILFESNRPYSPIFKGIEVEQDPRDWKNSVFETLKEVGEYAKENNIDIELISVTSQRASIIPINKYGKVLYNAITWQDRRSHEMPGKIRKKISMKDIYLKTGLRLDSYFSAPKIMWLKENMPEIYQDAYKIIGVQDYVSYLLTGKFVTDATQAARTLLMDIHTFAWDEDLIRLFGINRSKLCDIVSPGTIIGEIHNEIVEKTGLNEGIKVLLAGGDQQCAAVGLNVLSEGTLEANIGTGSFIIAYAKEPVFDENMRVLLSASAVPGKWIVEAGLLTSGNIYAWYKDQFYKESNQNFDLINKEVNESEPGAKGLVLIPHFKGSAAPYWNPLSKGVFFNATLEHKRGDFARSILEGIAFEMAENIDLIADMIGYVDIIHAAGGLTKFPTFNQIQSDIFNKAVSVYDSSEATALGALISSLVTLKKYNSFEEAFQSLRGKSNKQTYHSLPKNVYVYSRMLRVKKHLYRAIYDSQIHDYMNFEI